MNAVLQADPMVLLLNQFVATSTVPTQWKRVYVCPVPKVSLSCTHSDFRPISITPVFTRIIERTVVQHFLYPARFQAELPNLSFADQFAFRPSGSTTAALIYILYAVCQLRLRTHTSSSLLWITAEPLILSGMLSLLQKLAQLNMSDCVYNWMMDFFLGHTHCTRFSGLTSAFLPITGVSTASL